jgi:hypothetical protein
MATQSPGARLRETIAGVVAIGKAVSDEAAKVKAEAAAQTAQNNVEGVSGGGGSGQPGGA